MLEHEPCGVENGRVAFDRKRGHDSVGAHFDPSRFAQQYSEQTAWD